MATSPHEFRLMVTQRQGGIGIDELEETVNLHKSRGGLGR